MSERWADSEIHKREIVKLNPRRRKRCPCGCGTRATHGGTANGIGMMYGCELFVRRWVKQGTPAITRKLTK